MVANFCTNYEKFEMRKKVLFEKKAQSGFGGGRSERGKYAKMQCETGGDGKSAQCTPRNFSRVFWPREVESAKGHANCACLPSTLFQFSSCLLG